MLTLRPLIFEDAKMIYGWRNDPFIVKLGTRQQTVTWEQHLAWINESLASPKRIIFVIEQNHVAIGQLRFDITAKDQHSCVVSVYLLQEYIGKGMGTRALLLGLDLLKDRWKHIFSVYSFVRKDNPRAHHSFIKVGFKHLYADELHEVYAFTLQIIPHNRLTSDAAEVEAVKKVIESGYWAMGTQVDKLEQELCARLKLAHAAAVASGYSALRLSLLSLNVGVGDEVIVPAYSCVALANAVMSIGAKPIAADVDSSLLVLSAETVRVKMTERTKAVIAVHTFGNLCDIASLKALGVSVVEDCAHGFGPKGFGMHGDLIVLSFYATKFFGAGEGGAVVTRHADLAKFVRYERDYADKPASSLRQNDKMTNITAALAVTQLSRSEDFIHKRASVAATYLSALRDVSKKFRSLTLPINNSGIWYRFAVRESESPDDLILFLEKKGITASVPVENWLGSALEQNVKNLFREIVSLPLYPTLSEGEQDHIISSVREYYQLRA